MLIDLVEVITSDGISLSGAYFAPEGPAPAGVDALVFFHGDGGHFYRPLYLGLGQRLAAQGIAVVTANRRGHDAVASGAQNGPLKGYAFESVSESPMDYAAWLAMLRERGHRRIAIGGHSGGAVRSVYAQATERFEDVVAVVPVSPGEYDHEGIIALHKAAFTSPFQEAQAHVAAGRPDVFLRPGVPWGSMWSARAYVDCFNPDNRYSARRHAANITCPMLFIFGAEECAGPQVLPVCGAARKGLTEAGYAHVRVETIEGANHGYVGREQVLYATIGDFLRDLA